MGQESVSEYIWFLKYILIKFLGSVPFIII